LVFPDAWFLLSSLLFLKNVAKKLCVSLAKIPIFVDEQGVEKFASIVGRKETYFVRVPSSTGNNRHSMQWKPRRWINPSAY